MLMKSMDFFIKFSKIEEGKGKFKERGLEDLGQND
jgi:hypothetical protein